MRFRMLAPSQTRPYWRQRQITDLSHHERTPSRLRFHRCSGEIVGMRMLICPRRVVLTTLNLVLLASGCAHLRDEAARDLVGAWRGSVQFTNGAFAEVKDLEFMYVFNSGGTMTESSNYDGAPPVPPAYGVWRKVAARKYEAKYEYFWTRAPANFEALAKGGGWSPGGHGLLTQQITLSEDGHSFDSTVRYEVFDQSGKPTEQPSEAKATGKRVGF